ncbi:hypothetical protein AB0K48_26560 [Nonomuraea sp. NPDC055795]
MRRRGTYVRISRRCRCGRAAAVAVATGDERLGEQCAGPACRGVLLRRQG